MKKLLLMATVLALMATVALAAPVVPITTADQSIVATMSPLNGINVAANMSARPSTNVADNQAMAQSPATVHAPPPVNLTEVAPMTVMPTTDVDKDNGAAALAPTAVTSAQAASITSEPAKK